MKIEKFKSFKEGMRLFGGSSSTFDNPSAKKVKKIPNPDPNNYKIISHEVIGDFLILVINYPDCINYEGNKILVFKGTSLEDLKKQKLIDPHFSNNKKYISPIARFEPTKIGMNMAISFCKSYK